MATREQILGMFGATPAQVRQRQLNQEQAERDSSSSGMDKAGKAIGQGLGTLFGLKSPEMEMADQMQGAMQGVDLQDPTQLRALAQTVSSFNPQSALLIAEKAREIEQQTTGERVDLPAIVGYEPIMKLDIQGNSVKVGEKPIFQKVPHTKVDGKWTPIIDYGQSKAEGTPKEETTQSNAKMIYDPDSGNLKNNPNFDPKIAETVSMFGPGPGISSPTPSVDEPSLPAQSQGGFDPGVAVPMTGIPGQEPSTGPQRTGNFIPEDTGIPTQMPNIEGQVTFGDPTELKAVSDELRDQITALSNSDDPEKDAKIAALKKKRAQVSKLILGSRRQLASKNPLGGTR